MGPVAEPGQALPSRREQTADVHGSEMVQFRRRSLRGKYTTRKSCGLGVLCVGLPWPGVSEKAF